MIDKLINMNKKINYKLMKKIKLIIMNNHFLKILIITRMFLINHVNNKYYNLIINH